MTKTEHIEYYALTILLPLVTLAVGTSVFAVVRTMYARGRPVETCDIVMPTDRYALSYRFPVPD